MKVWQPEKSNGKFASYPNRLVETWFSTGAYRPDGTQFQEGQIIAQLPAGTPLHIEKIVTYKALDANSINVLGTVHFLVNDGELKFNFDYSSLDRIPWSLTRKQ